MDTDLPSAADNSLPSSRALLTSLIASIGKPARDTEHTTSNPLSDGNEETRSLILTLHTLFPNELLPALDLLDRGLVTRFKLHGEQTLESEDTPYEETHDEFSTSGRESQVIKQNATYYVRSAQQAAANARSKYRVDNPIYYEVHLNAWSCSCPAFAFAAFPAALSDDQPAISEDKGDHGTDHGWRFGGVTRGRDAPVCKHLLACVLIAHSDMFGSLMDEREVSAEEVAGWAAGWGD